MARADPEGQGVPAKAGEVVLAVQEAPAVLEVPDLTIRAQVEVTTETEEATRRDRMPVRAVQVEAAIRVIGRIKTVLPDGVAETARQAADRDPPRHNAWSNMRCNSTPTVTANSIAPSC
jgi:hypothetical protein